MALAPPTLHLTIFTYLGHCQVYHCAKSILMTLNTLSVLLLTPVRFANLSKFSLPQFLEIGLPSFQSAEPCTQCQIPL